MLEEAALAQWQMRTGGWIPVLPLLGGRHLFGAALHPPHPHTSSELKLWLPVMITSLLTHSILASFSLFRLSLKVPQPGWLKNNRNWFLDFSGGAVVKNPSANAGDMGLIPGPGRSRMLQSNYTHVPQLLSLHSRGRELQQEKLLQREACALQWGVAPLTPTCCNQRKPPCSNKDPVQAKKGKTIF